MKTITSANSIILLSVAGLFDAPQQLQGFSADDIFDTPAVNTSEIAMGLDGKLSAGWIPVPIVQSYSLQADSDSNALFEEIYAAQQAVREVYRLSGVIMLPSLNMTYTMTNGVLTNYSPTASAKKMMQPRSFAITWESMLGMPI